MRDELKPGGHSRPPGIADYLPLPEQSLLTTRTELTRIFSPFAADIEPLAEPVGVPALEVAPVVPVDDDPDELVSSVPFTSIFLPTSDDNSDALPSST
jgi:hypothetical protein